MSQAWYKSEWALGQVFRSSLFSIWKGNVMKSVLSSTNLEKSLNSKRWLRNTEEVQIKLVFFWNLELWKDVLSDPAVVFSPVSNNDFVSLNSVEPTFKLRIMSQIKSEEYHKETELKEY